MARPMIAREFGNYLVEAGVLTPEELNLTSRIVIDCTAGEAVQVYVQRYGDSDALKALAPMLAGLIRPGEETAQLDPPEGAGSDGED